MQLKSSRVTPKRQVFSRGLWITRQFCTGFITIFKLGRVLDTETLSLQFTAGHPGISPAMSNRKLAGRGLLQKLGILGTLGQFPCGKNSLLFTFSSTVHCRISRKIAIHIRQPTSRARLGSNTGILYELLFLEIFIITNQFYMQVGLRRAIK